MIGFEIKSKNEKMTVGLEKGVVSVIFNRVKNMERDEIQLSASGLNIENRKIINGYLGISNWVKKLMLK